MCAYVIRWLRPNRSFLSCAFWLTVTLGSPPTASAQIWDGGNGTNSWQDPGNWDPDGLPGDLSLTTLEASLTPAVTVSLMADVSFNGGLEGIDGLTIDAGYDLDTNGYFLLVDNLTETATTEVTGIGSNLNVTKLSRNPSMSAVDTDRLGVVTNGYVNMRGGRLKVDSDAVIDLSGRIFEYGELRFGGPTSPGTLLDIQGRITVQQDSFGIDRTLTLEVANNAPVGSTLSLSGSTGNGSIDVGVNYPVGSLHLIVHGATEDFEGTLNIGEDDSAEFSDDLTLLGGEINFAGGTGTATFLGTGTLATINGVLDVDSGTARIENEVVFGIASTATIAADSNLTFANTFTAGSSGTIDVGDRATLQFDGTGSQIEADVIDIFMHDDSKLMVHGDITIDAGTTMDFDWDGANENADTIVDGPDANLSVLGDHIDSVENGHNGDLSILNGGRVQVTINSVTDDFAKHGLLTLSSQASSNSSRLEALNGKSAKFDGTIVASGDGVSIIDGDDNVFEGTVDVSVDSGATLRVKNSTVLAGTWGRNTGTLQNSEAMTIDADTTMNFAFVDLDGPQGAATVTLKDPLPLNVDAISQGASNVFGQDNGAPTSTTMTIVSNIGNSGALRVQFNDPSAHWTIGQDATLVLIASLAGSEQIQGSDLRVDGQSVVVQGDSLWSDHTTLGASPAEFVIPNATSLTLTDGTLSRPNRIEGGRIVGAPAGNVGEIRIGTGTGLTGYGLIEADVNFAVANNFLMAADQDELRVNGTIIDVGRIGTANPGGTLRFGQPFNTMIADDALELNGGTVTGMAVTNGGVTGGFGTIKTQQFSQSPAGVTSASGGLLTIDVVAPQVAVTQGTLNAISGNLSFTDPLTGPFMGIVNVGGARTVDFQGGWNLAGAASRLNLVGGATTAHQAAVAGDTIVNGGAVVNVTREAVFRDDVRFGQLATVNIPTSADVLRIEGLAEVPINGASSAVFQGNGTLVIEPAAMFNVGTGVGSIAVNVRNDGTFSIDPLATGSADLGKGFGQSATGIMKAQLSGTASTTYDRLTVAGMALLAGTLEVSLVGGFVPSLGDSFSILSAVGGVNGQFDTERLPRLPGLIGFDVIYDPNDVLLRVVAFPDFNMDGLLDCIDVDSLVAVIAAGSNNPGFDLTADGSVSSSDLMQWLADAGAVNLASGNPYLEGDANLDGAVDGSDFGI
jgi:hypothetical protein